MNIMQDLDLPKFTYATFTDRDQLQQDIDRIRKTGVAYNIQEFHNGINAMATPIFANAHRVIGSLAIVGTSVDLDKETLEEYAESILEASGDVSNRLGGKFPEYIKI